MTNLRNDSVQPNPNVQNTDILSITMPMINRMKVEDKSESTITSYVTDRFLGTRINVLNGHLREETYTSV